MSPENARFHALIQGIVQGVGFRFFVYQHGNLLKLRGWVRNRINGDVEVMAEGSQKDLLSLLGKLKEGPELAQVVNTEIEWLPFKGDLPTFTVLPTDY